MEVKRRIRITKTKKKNPNNPMGRPEVYTEKIGAYICKELMAGKTLTKIVKDPRIPSVPTICSWLNKQHKNYKEDFFNNYNNARKIQAEILADETIDISDEKFQDSQRQALRVKTRHWLAGRMNSKFSDRMQLTGRGDEPLIPVQTKVVVKFIKGNSECQND